jgi:hypothetical protein
VLKQVSGVSVPESATFPVYRINYQMCCKYRYSVAYRPITKTLVIHCIHAGSETRVHFPRVGKKPNPRYCNICFAPKSK